MLSLITGDIMRKILLGLAVLFTTLPAMADDLGTLLQSGYKIIGRSTINDSFMGCEWNKTFPLANGQYFMCEETKSSFKIQNQGYQGLTPEQVRYNAARQQGMLGFVAATTGDPMLYAMVAGNKNQNQLATDQLAYQQAVANQYGVPYQQVQQAYNQQKANSYNLPIVILQNQYGTTKYIINGIEYRGKLF